MMTRVTILSAMLMACAMSAGCCRTYRVNPNGLPLDASGERTEGTYRLCDQIEVVSESLTWRTSSGARVDAEELSKRLMRQLSDVGVPRIVSPWTMTSKEGWLNDVWQDPREADYRTMPPSKAVTCSPVITLVAIDPPIVLVADRSALASLVSFDPVRSTPLTDREIPGWLLTTLVARGRNSPEGVSVTLPYAMRTGSLSPFDASVKCYAVTDTVTQLVVNPIDESRAAVTVPWGVIHLTRDGDSWFATGHRTASGAP